MDYAYIALNFLGHYIPGLVTQNYAKITERQRFPNLNVKRNYHRMIGAFMAPAPDFDFTIQIVYSRIVECRFKLPFDVGMDVPVEIFRKHNVPEEIIKYCDYFCHRTPFTHSLLGVALAALLGYCLYYKTSGGDKKYAMFGASVYGTQVLMNHLMFDITQGPLKPIPFMQQQMSIYTNYIPGQSLHDFLVVLPIILSLGVFFGIKLYQRYNKNKVEQIN